VFRTFPDATSQQHLRQLAGDADPSIRHAAVLYLESLKAKGLLIR
jgi:hypothetical protein